MSVKFSELILKKEAANIVTKTLYQASKMRLSCIIINTFASSTPNCFEFSNKEQFIRFNLRCFLSMADLYSAQYRSGLFGDFFGFHFNSICL